MKDQDRTSAGFSTQGDGAETEATNPHRSEREQSGCGAYTAADRDLVRRCIGKDKEAWDEFVARYSRVIQHQIRESLRAWAASFQGADVEDFCHSVFLAFLRDDGRKLRCFEGKCSLARWVRMITTNTVIDELRRERPRGSLDVASPQQGSLKDKVADPRPGAEAQLAHEQERSLLERAFGTISPADRKLAHLLYELEMPAEAIAEALQISKGAVYTRKHRLREKLRRALRV